jgi:hypothetical protein
MVQEPYGVWGGLTPRERERILHEPGCASAGYAPHIAAS